jgi:putative SOS response-associated peptidase YedK
MPLPFGRMPVILHKADESAWIDPNVTDFSTIVTGMRPYEDGKLAHRQVSSEVNSKTVDDERLLRPTTSV